MPSIFQTSPRLTRILSLTVACALWAQPGEARAQKKKSAKAQAAAQATLPVYDFCAIESRSGARAFTRKKVILFQIGGLEKIEAGEAVADAKGQQSGQRQVLKKIGAAAQFSQVWAENFPMPRFYNLMVSQPAPDSLVGAQRLSVAQVAGALQGEEGQFVAYSAPCADYLAIPQLTHYEAKWETVTSQRKSGGRTVTTTRTQLATKPRISLSIYQREKDHFVRVAQLAEEAGGLFDMATDLGASITQVAALGSEQAAGALSAAGGVGKYLQKAKAIAKTVQKHNEQLTLLRALTPVGAEEIAEVQRKIADITETIEMLSQQQALIEDLVRDPQGSADKLARSQSTSWDRIASGIPAASCYQDNRLTCTEGSFWLPPRSVGVAGMSERASAVCKNVGEDQSRIATCEVRVRAENLSHLLRKAGASVDGWRLFAPLVRAISANAPTAPPSPSISLGVAEGVRRSALFRAVVAGENGPERVGFARVTKAGPGGPLGEIDPSQLAARGGSLPEGARMEEHPQIGVSLGLEGVGSFAMDTKGAAANLEQMVGGSVTVGYNLSPFVDWGNTELWLRAQLDVGYATVKDFLPGVDTDWLMLNVLAGPELKYYLFSRVDLFIAVLGGISVVAINEANDGEQDAMAYVPSLRVGAGFDILLHPDWQLRIGGGYRANLQDFKLDDADDDEGFQGCAQFGGCNLFTQQEIGNLSGIEARLGLTYIF